MMKNSGSSTTTGSQAFCLKLNSHQSHMIESFQKLYNEEVMVDCTISCAGGTLKAHKLVLSACSPYFTSLFSTFTNPYQYPVVVIKDMPFPDLKAIIEFMYRGEVTVPQAILPSVLESAKTLSITGLCDIKIANFETSSSNTASTTAPLFPNRSKISTAGKRNRRRANRRNSREQQQQDSGSADGSADGSSEESYESETQVCKQMKQEDEDDAAPMTGTGQEIDENKLPDASDQQQQEQLQDDEPETDEDVAVAMDLADAVSSENNSILAPIASSSTSSSPAAAAAHPKLGSSPFGQRMTPSASLKQDLRQQRIHKLQQQTGGLSGRKMWSDEEVRTLVRIWEEESARVWASAGKKLLSLKKISELLQDEGIDRDISQVEGKIKALKRDYKAVKSEKAITSVQTRMAPYLEKLDRIFDHETDL